jgi:hypothetical protein
MSNLIELIREALKAKTAQLTAATDKAYYEAYTEGLNDGTFNARSRIYNVIRAEIDAEDAEELIDILRRDA